MAIAINIEKDIVITGARVHNLKNASVRIKRNSLTVFTGLSGSGKSSLAFDTLFAEGQRRYIESLSAYARQFLGKIEKPAVDSITGLSPAIAIEQKVNTRNPRSTVGTSTEIYEYLKLLFTRLGVTYAAGSNVIVKRHNHLDVVKFLSSLPSDQSFTILAPVTGKDIPTAVKSFSTKGYSRILTGGELIRIEEFANLKKTKKDKIFLMVDRFECFEDSDESQSRLADSIQAAFYEGAGTCTVFLPGRNEYKSFNKDFEHDGVTYPEPSLHLFSFNNPLGACPECEGFGSVIGIDADLIVPDKSLSVYEGAVSCWKGDKMGEWLDDFIMRSAEYKFPVHKSYSALSSRDLELLWKGNGKIHGIDRFFKFLGENSYKIQYRVMLSRYRGKTICPTCGGNRLRPETGNIKVGGLNISQVTSMQAVEALEYVNSLKLDKREEKIATRILSELKHRLGYLIGVGLGYLSLNRASNSLSGGESQRIQLSTSLGSPLTGSVYVLDEPSIGLHPRDTQRLIAILKKLRDIGNTLVVVEHDEDIIREADDVVDLGPEAGRLGGSVVFQGRADEASGTLTSDYLNGKRKIEVPKSRRKWRNSIHIKEAFENNLKKVSVKIPLGVLTCISGVSGSGKSSLIRDVLYKSLYNKIVNHTWSPGKYKSIEGDIEGITQVELVDQNPIGRSSRSNPVTYLKAYDEIRSLYCSIPEAKRRGLNPSDFSFNVEGGRCETCQGEGEVTVEMQFMSDIRLVCEECGGKRFKDEILEITFLGKSISDLLNMTIDEAMDFFTSSEEMPLKSKKISEKLSPLQEAGLGYIQLGQSSSTLSGGEAQRVKLAYFLSKKHESGSILFLFDEPSTGLHLHDINKLLVSLNALVAKGHSVVVIEHHMDIIKCADWVIDLGPGGGNDGGNIVFEGSPEDLAECRESETGKFIAGKIRKRTRG